MEETKPEPLITDAVIGERLRDVRRGINMSQAELAQALAELGLRLHQTQISAVEKGERPLRVTELVAFTRVLRIPPETVLRGPGDELDAGVVGNITTRLTEVMALLRQSAPHSAPVKQGEV